MGGTKKTYDPLVDSTMSLGDHLEELRTRILLALAGLVIAFILCAVFGKYIIALIKWPYASVMTKYGEDPTLTTLAPAEVFISYIKICLISGLILSSPWVFYHLWMFIAAGLYPHERRYVHIAVPFSVFLFVMGSLFFLFAIAPLCLKFFIKFGNMLGLTRTWTLGYYVTFIAHLMLVFGIAFQTPTAIFFLNRTRLVSLKSLMSARKYILLVIVIVAAMATPPDVVSQVALAIPLYFLFELGIILCWFAERKKKAKTSE